MEEQFNRDLGAYLSRLSDEKDDAEKNGDTEKVKDIQSKIDEIHNTF